VRGAVVIVLLGGIAHAEPQADPLPFGVVATAGIGTGTTVGLWEHGADFEAIAAIQLDAGVRFRNAMVGVHLSIDSGTPQTVTHAASMFDEEWLYTYRPMHIGVTGHLVKQDRFYVAPWLGVQTGWRRQECSTFTDHRTVPPSPPATTCMRLDWESLQRWGPALGFSVGADAFALGRHRVTVTATFTYADISDEQEDYDFSYTSLWLGVGYRFWDR
jgi:hypothetical protein